MFKWRARQPIFFDAKSKKLIDLGKEMNKNSKKTNETS